MDILSIEVAAPAITLIAAVGILAWVLEAQNHRADKRTDRIKARIAQAPQNVERIRLDDEYPCSVTVTFVGERPVLLEGIHGAAAIHVFEALKATLPGRVFAESSFFLPQADNIDSRG